MSSPLDLSLPRTVSVNNPSSDLSVLPTHIAQHQQLQEQHRRRQQAAQGLELDTLSAARLDKAPVLSPSPSRDTSSELPDHARHLLHDYSDSETPQMGSRSRSADKKPSDRPSSSSSSTADQNGHTTGAMNSHVEFRGKSSSSHESPTASLMRRESFSLDHEPPQTPLTPVSHNNSFWELPRQDRRNFLLLVLLYFLQGIPMGLATGSVPFLLKSHMSYSQIGVFSLASYPYSLKLLWSPIVDAVWSPKLGRRKSWILPIQLLSGFGMIWLGGRAKQMMVDAGANDGAGVWTFTGWWFFLVFMCATQDIAVDGGFTLELMILHRLPRLPSRLGADSSLAGKLVIRLDCTDRRPDCGPVHVLHRLPCL